jgi:hypothetical protein
MRGAERPQPSSGRHAEQEYLDPRHFYAAYVFDDAEGRQGHVETLLKLALGLGYPVRYWWLSDAVDLRDMPDRLIVCVHHAEDGENAGMVLYAALEVARAEEHVDWDGLEAAALEEYQLYGRRIGAVSDINQPNGMPLFPTRSNAEQ